MPTSRFRILLSQTAVRQLQALPVKSSAMIREKLLVLQEGLFEPRTGIDVKRLRVSRDPPFYRLRVGDYRVIFTVNDNEIRVTEILHRSKAYRWLD